MTRRKSFTEAVSKLDTQERVKLARTRMNRMWRYDTELIQLRENNRLLASELHLPRVPRGCEPERVLLLIRRCCMGMELLKLRACWEGPELKKFSVPSIIGIMDDPAVLAQLRSEATLGARDAGPEEDWQDYPEGEERNVARERTAQRRYDEALAHWDEAWTRVKQLSLDVAGSPAVRRIKTYRDSHLAHHLSLDQPISETDLPQLGEDEPLLVSQTLTACNILRSLLTNATTEWSGVQEHARANALAFWSLVEGPPV